MELKKFVITEVLSFLLLSNQSLSIKEITTLVLTNA